MSARPDYLKPEDKARTFPAIMKALSPATEPVDEDWIIRRVMFQNFNPWDDGYWKHRIVLSIKLLVSQGKLKTSGASFNWLPPTGNTSFNSVTYYEIANPLDRLAAID